MIAGLIRSDTLDREDLKLGAVCAGCFCNQGLDANSGKVKTVEQILYEELAVRLQVTYLSITDMVKIAANHKDRSELG